MGLSGMTAIKIAITTLGIINAIESQFHGNKVPKTNANKMPRVTKSWKPVPSIPRTLGVDSSMTYLKNDMIWLDLGRYCLNPSFGTLLSLHWRRGGDQTRAEAGDGAADQYHRDRVGDCQQIPAEGEEDPVEHQGVLAADRLGDRAAHQTPDQRAQRDDASDPRLRLFVLAAVREVHLHKEGLDQLRFRLEAGFHLNS